MGNIEEIAKKRKSRKYLQEAILTAIEGVGVLAIGAIAPSTTKLLKSFGYDPLRRHKEAIKRSREKLVALGLLIYENGFLRLTEKGEARLRQFQLQEYKLEKPKKWDGRWRMLIFDIPEYRKTMRDKIRNTLIDIGFIRIQDSVWLYPYDCEDLVVLLKADFKVGKDLLYLVVESIENDKSFRIAFSLPVSVV